MVCIYSTSVLRSTVVGKAMKSMCVSGARADLWMVRSCSKYVMAVHRHVIIARVESERSDFGRGNG
jgi:hypothetical protein